MRVRVTAVNADGATNARSEQTDVVASNAAPLTNTARPTITGEARVGQELTASEGTWTGNPTTFSFQWQRCNIDAITCLDVTGATGRTYGVRLADLGFRLRVQVVARKDGRSGTATSIPTAVVQPTTPVTNARPTLRILKVTFLGARVYVRFRVCDDTPRNLGDPRSRDAPRRASFAAALRDSCPAAPVRCVHAKLASGSAVPWPWALHDHASGTRCLRSDEPACAAHVPSIAVSGWHQEAARCQHLRLHFSRRKFRSAPPASLAWGKLRML